MDRTLMLIVPAALVAGAATVERAHAQPVIISLPAGAYGTAISGDGSTVVGSADSGSHPQAFRWTRASRLQRINSWLADSWANAVSSDGSTVVGTGSGGVCSVCAPESFRWTPAQGMTSLWWPGSATAVSGDGTVAIGTSYNAYWPATYWVTRWTLGGFAEVLPADPMDDPVGVSLDGMVVAGNGPASAGRRAYRWTDAQGTQSLGTLSGGEASWASAVSGNGVVIVGSSLLDGLDPPEHAFRWNAKDGMEDLGVLGGFIGSRSHAVNGDGSIVVGSSWNGYPVFQAFLWTESLGMVNLNEHLPRLGVDLSGWNLMDAVGISLEGSTIMGRGTLNGEARTWVVSGLPAGACYADCNADGTLTVADFACFQTTFVQGGPYADCNADGQLTVADFACFQAKFVAGCP